ncbi:MAG: NAD(+) kinase [Steroidobacteraceae bacterium]
MPAAKRSAPSRATGPAKSNFQTVALLGPSADPRVAATLTTLTQHLVQLDRKVLLDPEFSGKLPPQAERVSELDIAARSDLVITVGGDGTMLRAARLLAGSGVPVLGINRGRLGFLADISPQGMFEQIDAILAGQFERGSRSLLQVTLIPAQGKQQQRLAINDCVLQKWETGRMLDYETWIDGHYVNTHGGDGVIVASATGSTAYALSCGGPIIHPSLDAMVIAPICPHTLSDRPIVIAASSTVEIRRVQDRATKAQVTCDGDMLGDLNVNDRLLVGPAHVRVNLLHPIGHDYYRILRAKLHWGRGALDKRQRSEVEDEE